MKREPKEILKDLVDHVQELLGPDDTEKTSYTGMMDLLVTGREINDIIDLMNEAREVINEA